MAANSRAAQASSYSSAHYRQVGAKATTAEAVAAGSGEVIGHGGRVTLHRVTRAGPQGGFRTWTTDRFH
jgi:hypothetical protein